MEIFSFFSGIGFLDLGFETAGADISFVNEKVAKNDRFWECDQSCVSNIRQV